MKANRNKNMYSSRNYFTPLLPTSISEFLKLSNGMEKRIDNRNHHPKMSRFESAGFFFLSNDVPQTEKLWVQRSATRRQHCTGVVQKLRRQHEVVKKCLLLSLFRVKMSKLSSVQPKLDQKQGPVFVETLFFKLLHFFCGGYEFLILRSLKLNIDPQKLHLVANLVSAAFLR